MALKERTSLGKVTINHQSGGNCEVQEVHEIYDDATGEIKYSSFSRSVVDPDDDIKAENLGVKHITDRAWTPEIRTKEQNRKLLDLAETEAAHTDNLNQRLKYVEVKK